MLDAHHTADHANRGSIILKMMGEVRNGEQKEQE